MKGSVVRETPRGGKIWTLASTALLAVAIVGAATAQDNQTANEAFSPRFEDHHWRGPLYPRQGREAGVAGIVHLCCRARVDRTLACEIGVEWPRGRGFGDASLRIANALHLTQASYTQSQSLTAFRLPVRWQIAPTPPALDEAEARIDVDTVDLCGPNTGRAAPDDYLVITAERVS